MLEGSLPPLHPVHHEVNPKMPTITPSSAFVISILPRPLSRTRSIRTVSPHHYPTPISKRRLRFRLSANLYPDPDTPESLDNLSSSIPSTPPLQPEPTEQELLEKLNSRQQNRRDPTKVVRTTLDAASVTLSSFSDPADGSATPDQGTIDYASASKALWRLGWCTWWVQLILTVVAGVILLFSFAFPGVNVRSSASAVGFILSALGIVLAFLSLFWTYSYTRLSLWLGDEVKRTEKLARVRITGKLRVGLVLALVGLLVSLLGTQAIVGTLLARLLSAGIATTHYSTYQAAGVLPPGAGVVQPVDVLIIQACANAMMALMAALISTVWLRGRAKKWQEARHNV